MSAAFTQSQTCAVTLNVVSVCQTVLCVAAWMCLKHDSGSLAAVLDWQHEVVTRASKYFHTDFQQMTEG